MRSEAVKSVTRQFTVALAGNPNSGKTTLFNGLTGGTQKIGNWPGVTVEKKVGYIGERAERLQVVDLPGIYAFHSSSEDERISQEFLLTQKPELVVNIVDASNLERNLYLTVQLIEMGMPVVVLLNMADIAAQEGISVDAAALEQELGVPVYSMTATNSEDIKKIRTAILSHRNAAPAVSAASKITYPASIQRIIDRWTAEYRSQDFGPWLAVKILEGNEFLLKDAIRRVSFNPEELDSAQETVLAEDGIEADVLIANARYDYIQQVAEKSVRRQKVRRSISARIDDVVLNRFLGIPVFLGVMYLSFWVAVNVGFAFIDFFDVLAGTLFVDGVSHLLGLASAPTWLTTILADGVGAGIQTVATFIPVVFFMFLMLSILEDSGYMARAAFVMDRVMQSIGLPGKAFVPMIVGFGCTVPAILGARTLENKRDRFLTIFITPFMSCSARLPVYALFGAAFFGAQAGGIVFSIYMIGILMAIGTGYLLRKTVFKGGDSTFVMELPKYHLPTLRSTFGSAWIRLRFFIKRAGKAILLVVLLLSIFNSLGTDGSFGNEDTEDSFLSAVGKSITPVFRPMGIEDENWPATVGLFTGLFAKEVIVGTLNSLYAQDATAADVEADFSLREGVAESFTALRDGLSGIFSGLSATIGLDMIGHDEAQTAALIEAEGSVFTGMRSQFNPFSAYAYLLFVLIYFPCVAAFGTSIQEMGWKYGLMQAAYLTILAWSTATLFYQLAFAHNPLLIAVPLVIMTGVAVALYWLGKRPTERPAETG